MIINCPDCDHEVSDKAEMCPKCGCPIAGKTEEPKVITIEHTKKKYKLQHAFGVVFLIVGVVLIATDKSERKPLAVLGGFLIFIAVVLFIMSKVGSWRDHA